MGSVVTKSQSPVPQIQYGCCSAVRLGVWVNAEVGQVVKASNGRDVLLSEAAVAKIRQAYTGVPLKVIMKRPCAVCCGNLPCCKCKSGGCNCACPPPPYPIQWDSAAFSDIWFGKTNSDSKCGTPWGTYFANACCFIPYLLSVHFPNMVEILPEDANLITDRPTYMFEIDQTVGLLGALGSGPVDLTVMQPQPPTPVQMVPQAQAMH